MHKYAKLTTTAVLAALIMGVASSCGGGAKDLTFWAGFGQSYTAAVNELFENYSKQSGVSIDVQGQGGYDKLQTNINNSISTGSYPHFTHGYPDHFAGYISSDIQLSLDTYIANYNKEHNADLLSDFYPAYMVENQTLKYDASGKGYTMGLPFNKSTEVLGYNSAFFDYAKSLDSEIALPTTWTQYETVAPKFMSAMDTLYGKYLHGKPVAGEFQKYDNWKVSANASEAGYTMVLNCKEVTKEKFRLMCWDSTDNMFITIVRQWGGQYTSCTPEDLKTYKHGWAEFVAGESRVKTKEALAFFRDNLHSKKYFGLPNEISDSSYSSDAFKANKCMFVVCSSGGLSYNTGTVPFKVNPVPYLDADHKYVISQGTNFCILDQGTDEQKQKAFNAIVDLATGELQGQWAVSTGYYPASKSATNSKAYQEFLNSKSESPLTRAYQDSSVLNEKEYMVAEKKWVKFVDPGFNGSSTIRATVKGVMQTVLNNEQTLDAILDDVAKKISTYVRK